MGKQQNNFKQAMAELLNGRNSDPAQEDIAEQPLTAAVEAERPLPPVERPQSLQVEIPAWTGRGGSVIAEEMTVEGKVYTDSPLQIRGRIKGSVAGRGSLLISGGVEGDVQCGELQLQGAKVLGNVQSSGAVRIDAQAVVSGDLAAGEFGAGGQDQGQPASRGDGRAGQFGCAHRRPAGTPALHCRGRGAAGQCRGHRWSARHCILGARRGNGDGERKAGFKISGQRALLPASDCRDGAGGAAPLHRTGGLLGGGKPPTEKRSAGFGGAGAGPGPGADGAAGWGGRRGRGDCLPNRPPRPLRRGAGLCLCPRPGKDGLSHL
ncbi:hypothetical protein GT747_13280 [Bittarella massiliensis]|uniref:Polymer-forming cytoskeletal protein n=1 Tax=Bittarella massiliensis (ex Durand et al. 2017) TaxID=1720313 RepID=A0ABW9WZY5_9FIRM|nr:hypothetical protein [Bittarella massiliensis (ex Durand et al. 2017)]